ncbi:MAG TPA: O-acetyl-ADP-ribose deacetylase [Chloroflexia bacterium]|nr:O-acetyl-ADP-ribose deacetylase [Chloroflexia bacterium]
MSSRITITKGDITRLEVDAIVNAANTTLLGGGGVDGAIHKAAGAGLLEECRELNGCDTGEAKITGGYDLPAKWVIHTVGPVWRGGGSREDDLLALCYRNTLALARQNDVHSIAFPSISTGAYGFPVDRAAVIALREIKDFFRRNSTPEHVTVICFNDKTYESYKKAAGHDPEVTFETG